MEWLGQGRARAAGWGQSEGRGRGGVPLRSKALRHRDLVLRPAKPRFPQAHGTEIRPAALIALLDRSGFSVPRDRLLRFVVRTRGMEKGGTHLRRDTFIPQ